MKRNRKKFKWFKDDLVDFKVKRENNCIQEEVYLTTSLKNVDEIILIINHPNFISGYSKTAKYRNNLTILN